jgi:hypothetical protein
MLTYYERKKDGGHELLDTLVAIQKERLMKQARLLKKENYEGLKSFLTQIDEGDMGFVKDLEPDAYNWAGDLVLAYEELHES